MDRRGIVWWLIAIVMLLLLAGLYRHALVILDTQRKLVECCNTAPEISTDGRKLGPGPGPIIILQPKLPGGGGSTTTLDVGAWSVGGSQSQKGADYELNKQFQRQAILFRAVNLENTSDLVTLNKISFSLSDASGSRKLTIRRDAGNYIVWEMEDPTGSYQPWQLCDQDATTAMPDCSMGAATLPAKAFGNLLIGSGQPEVETDPPGQSLPAKWKLYLQTDE